MNSSYKLSLWLHS